MLSYDLPLEQVVSRLSGRRTCPGCKAVFHVEARPPKVAGVCDHCGGKLYQREDDRPESIRVRMEAYERSTAPLADFYRQRKLLVSISAEGSPEDIFKRTLRCASTPRSRRSVACLLAIAAGCGTARSQPSKEFLPPAPAGQQWKLAWQDEFDGKTAG